MATPPTLRYYRTAERPDIQLWLLDDDDNLIDFSGGSYAFVFKVGTPGLAADFTKSSGITGAAGSGTEGAGTPNVTIAFTNGELDALPAGGYDWQLRATTATLDRIYQGKIEVGAVIL